MIIWINRLMKRLLTWFFELLYHSMAWMYDLISASVSFGRWNHWIMEITPEISGQRILELGFGPGHLLVNLFKGGYQILGLDESIQMCRIAQKKILNTDSDQYKNIIIRGNARGLPFANNVIDTIAATFPSEYIIDLKTVSDCYRVLKPGGRVVILAGVKIGGKKWYKRLLRQIYQITHQNVEEIEPQTPWLAPIRSAGFQVNVIQRNYLDDQLSIILLGKDENPFSIKQNHVQ
jgi:ubiquinone/menaquinone biosynthesis C-methylase UbiE